MDHSHRYLKLALPREARLVAAARDAEPVRGLTHGFYKYPARFSPAFARTVIETFTNPGQLVIDPYVGGGTSLVEALASGREAIGTDISPLAEFVTRVKCTIFSVSELDTLERWSVRLSSVIDIHASSKRFTEYDQLGYYRHLDHPLRWRLRKGIEQALSSAMRLGTPRLEGFGRCAVLRTAQWALDGRRNLPTIDEFRASLTEISVQMVQGARELRTAVNEHGRYSVAVIHRSAAGLEHDELLKKIRCSGLLRRFRSSQ